MPETRPPESETPLNPKPSEPAAESARDVSETTQSSENSAESKLVIVPAPRPTPEQRAANAVTFQIPETEPSEVAQTGSNTQAMSPLIKGTRILVSRELADLSRKRDLTFLDAQELETMLRRQGEKRLTPENK